MSYNGTDLSPDPLFLQTGSYDARSDRKSTGDEIAAGVVGAGDYAVTYSGGTLVMNVAAGVAYIKGGNIADQGTYRQYISAGTTVTLPAADATNPRIDTIIVRTLDNTADGSGLSKGRVEVVPGTATVGATLLNLNGKNPLTSLTDVSLSFTVLAYVLVPANALTLTNTATNVRDARPFAKLGASVVGLDGVIQVGNMNVESNTAAETDWYGGAGSGITIPIQYLRNDGSRVYIESIQAVTINPGTTPTHRFKMYVGGVNNFDSTAFAWLGAANAGGPTLLCRTKICLESQLSSAFATGNFLNCTFEVEISDPTAAGVGGSMFGTAKASVRYIGGSIANGPASAATTLAFRFTHQWGTANANNIFGASVLTGRYKVYSN